MLGVQSYRTSGVWTSSEMCGKILRDFPVLLMHEVCVGVM